MEINFAETAGETVTPELRAQLDAAITLQLFHLPIAVPRPKKELTESRAAVIIQLQG
jgi:hypothetical protein